MDHNKLRRTTLDPAAPFDFSQANLQDYRDCRRRFQLRHIQKLHWPAPQAEPIRENEAAIRRGERFHRLAQQAALGVAPEALEQAAAADPDPALIEWWLRFAALLPTLQIGRGRAEQLLAAPLGRHRLLAKYDFIQHLPDGRVIIFDWKTSPRRPRRANLDARLQTIVYPYVLAQTGRTATPGATIPPAQIEMIYWFAAFPAEPERFSYTAARFARDGKTLLELAAEIESLREDQFELTSDEKNCRFCVYRSLCARGTQAGPADEFDDLDLPDAEPEINFDQISEIGF